jgi:hypothetical protein
LSPTPSPSSAVRVPQSPDSSASLLETEETPQNILGDTYVPEPAAEGDIQMEYSSD